MGGGWRAVVQTGSTTPQGLRLQFLQRMEIKAQKKSPSLAKRGFEITLEIFERHCMQRPSCWCSDAPGLTVKVSLDYQNLWRRPTE